MTSTLATALVSGDSVAVAFALRNGGAVVPMLDADGPPQVRVFRRGDADKYMLLLFSSIETYTAMLPDEDAPASEVYEASALLDFLTQNVGVLEIVWFDVAGPHSMQATPQDIIAALELPRAR
ncbi:MAG TPA: dehydrogenase [Galbitalea sp.]|nr:dehydrogenase [Galbitalea sp.]